MKRLLSVLSALLIVGGAALAQTITVISPNGGESWKLETTQNITWTYANVPGNTKLKLILLKDGVRLGDIADNVELGTAGDGAFPWAVGTYIGGTAPVDDGYKIRIRAMDDSNVIDASDQTFAIAAASEGGGTGLQAQRQKMPAFLKPLRVAEPASSAVWTVGETHIIRWTAGVQVKYPLSIFLVSEDHRVPIVDIGKVEQAGSTRPESKTWVVTNNIYSGKYCIRITSADRAEETHSLPFTISEKRLRTFDVLPSGVANKVHWGVRQEDSWIAVGEAFYSLNFTPVPDPGGSIIKYGYQRWAEDEDNYSYMVHRSLVTFNLGQVLPQLTHPYVVKHVYINWKKAANSPQACAPVMWWLKAHIVLEQMFGMNFDIFPKQQIAGDQAVLVQMGQQWLSDPSKNFGILVQAAFEGNDANGGQCVQLCDGVVLKLEIEEDLVQ